MRFMSDPERLKAGFTLKIFIALTGELYKYSACQSVVNRRIHYEGYFASNDKSDDALRNVEPMDPVSHKYSMIRSNWQVCL